MARVVILGAGPAGLQASLDLARGGHQVAVLEAADRVGGMAASIEVSGQRVDLGSHRLHPATPPAFLGEIRKLLGDDLQTRERNGRLRLDGRWLGFPLRATDLARHAPPAFTARVVFDTLASRFRRTPVTTFGDAIRQGLGPTVATSFYDPYALKLYGVPADRLSVELADRRVSASSVTDIVKRLVRARNASGRTFLYPRRGYGQIVEALADAATNAGATIQLATRATSIEVASSGTVQVSTAGPDGRAGRDTEADVVLSSVPLSTLATLLPDVPQGVHEALATMRTRALVLVYLTLATDQYTPFDAHYIPELSCTTARLSEPKNYRDGDDPPGQTVLCAEIPCWQGDDIWNAPDAELHDMVQADLQRLDLPTAIVTAVTSVRLPSVYPVYEPGTTAARAELDAWAAELPRVLVFGRQGLAAPDNLHHVMAMGRTAAGVVTTDGDIDRVAWKRALADFATHVVED